jgi:ABC-type multidrug transport system fused ATPase/permease subunit
VASYKNFFRDLKAYLHLFTRVERNRFFVVLGLMIVTGFVDIIGVGSVVPFLAVVGNPSVIHHNKILALAYHLSGVTTDAAFIVLLGLGVIAFLIGTSALRAGFFYIMTMYSKNRLVGLSTRLFRHYMNQKYPFFLYKNSSELLKRFTEDITNSVGGVMDPIMSSVSKLVVIVGLVILLFYSNPMMALFVGVLLGGVYVVLFLLLKGTLARRGKDSNELYKKRMKILTESFSGIKEIKFFHLEDSTWRRYSENAAQEFGNNAWRDVLGNLPRYLMEALAFGGIVALVLFLLGTGSSLDTLLPVLGLYAFAGYKLLPYFQQIYSDFAKVRYSFVRVGEVVKAFHEGDPQSTAPQGELPAPLAIQQEIRVMGLSFRYERSPRWILKDLNLSLPSCSTVGVIGGSGEGKSTLVDILLGLIPVEEGAIQVDGEPLTSQRLLAWRQTVGYVPQSIFLADATVAENIAFGESWDEIDWQRMDHAVEMANIKTLVEKDLPEGYKTPVGERGIRLSGGQRQRLGIARALYRNPSVLIMDEATSSLDNESETVVMEAIHNLAGFLTILIVAHRLTTLRSCQSIYRLQGGRLELVGDFKTVMENEKSRL